MNPDFLFHFWELVAQQKLSGLKVLMDHKTIRTEISCPSSDYLPQYFLYFSKPIKTKSVFIVGSLSPKLILIL